MNQTTQLAAAAFEARQDWRSGNTFVTASPTWAAMHLHNNMIAIDNANGFFITTAGWNTPTTRARLNGLPGVEVRVIKGQLMLNGEPWDGEWTKIGGETDAN